MKKWILWAVVLLLLAGCTPAAEPPATEVPTTQPPTTQPPTTQPPTTQPSATQPPTTEAPTEPEHSSLYIPGLSVEDVITYFNEVCLDGEFINSGDPSYVQKWADPICCILEGDYTPEDMEVLDTVSNWLNHLEGFPGFTLTEEPAAANLRIHFCTEQEMVDLMGSNFRGMDGGVTFWYDWENRIYDAVICCRNDIDQTVRNSVIIEEIYNGLGPIQDTALRPDSIIYQEYTFPQWMSDVDELILQLLYHPEIKTGMNAEECRQVIRKLYY